MNCNKQEIIYIDTDFIRLDSALKLAGVSITGGNAKLLIQQGDVSVNGEVCLMRGKKLREGDTAEYNGLKIIVKNK